MFGDYSNYVCYERIIRYIQVDNEKNTIVNLIFLFPESAIEF